MKKFIKKLLACAVMGFSLFMFTACGEVKVTLYYGDSNKEIKVAKDGKQEIIDEIKACGFTPNAKLPPVNQYQIAIQNLRDNYNNRAYIRKCIS